MNPLYDLIVLAADAPIEATIKGILSRPQKLAIRPPSCLFFTHPWRDSGCLHNAHVFLQAQAHRAAHALVLFDREGCGRESLSREQLELLVERNLAETGWRDRSAVIVLDPELEVWVWSDSPEVDTCLGWNRLSRSLRVEVQGQGYWSAGEPKPTRPKDALRWALREADKKPSAAIFEDLAKRVSFRRCADAAFHKLCTVLCNWFGKATPPEEPAGKSGKHGS